MTKYCSKIVERLQKTFLTPFEPADVQALATALDDVLDSIEDAAFVIAAYRLERIPAESVDFSRIVQRSCSCLQQALQNIARKRPVIDKCMLVGDLEREADILERRLMGELFQNERDPIALLACKELFEVVERITDRCDDVANVLESISAKG